MKIYFEGGISKQYDVKKSFERFPELKKLESEELFGLVKIDVGGFGLVWNDEIDLPYYEIWDNGEIIKT